MNDILLPCTISRFYLSYLRCATAVLGCAEGLTPQKRVLFVGGGAAEGQGSMGALVIASSGDGLSQNCHRCQLHLWHQHHNFHRHNEVRVLHWYLLRHQLHGVFAPRHFILPEYYQMCHRLLSLKHLFPLLFWRINCAGN